MQKDFAKWHIRKMQLNQLQNSQYFREREVWWTAIGHNIGSEEDGKGVEFARPVLILRKFNATLFLGLPLSTTKKIGPYYFPITVAGLITKVLLSHIRNYDARRLLDKIDSVDKNTFSKIQRQMNQLIVPNPSKKFPPRFEAEG